jgi:hypothetical protein
MQKVFLLLFLSFNTLAQNIQWANKVIGDAADDKNAKSILGHPDALKLNEENKDKAWHPNQKSDNSNISVGFRNPMQVKQVIIAANCAVGNVTSVMLIDIFGRRVPIFTSQPSSPYTQHHLWHLRLPQKTNFEVEAIYIEANPTLSTRYPTEIDAIGITSMDTTITYADIEKLYSKENGVPAQKPTVGLPINLPDNVPQKITKQSLWSRKKSLGTQVAPVLSLDENLLFFTAFKERYVPNERTLYNKQDVWVSEKDKKGDWSPAINLPEPVNNIENNAITGISADGRRMYLLNNYLDNGKMTPGFSVSSFDGKNWSKPVKMVVENYKNFGYDVEFSVGMNEKVMLISYIKDSLKLFTGTTSKDIYVSFLKNDGNWSEPKYTGNTINTSKHESAPFIAYDSKTIYFSSYGFGGYGDSDIYMTKRLDSTWTNWSEPVNLGKGINTPKWDAYFWVAASGDYAFTCSEVFPQDEDIYKVNLYPSIKPEPVAILSGKVKNTDGEPILVDISMQEQPKTVFEDYTTSNDFDGNYHLIVPVGAKYTLKVTKRGYQTFVKEIDLTNKESLQKIEMNFALNKLE